MKEINTLLKVFLLIMTINPLLGFGQDTVANLHLSSDTKKWFPGHYIMMFSNENGTDQLSLTSPGMNFLRGTDGHLFKGIRVFLTWGNYETATPGVYNFSAIRNLLDNMPTGKKVILLMSWSSYKPCKPWPAYMDENPTYSYGGVGDPLTATLKVSSFWNVNTMNRWIAFMQAFANEFDGHPALAYVSGPELAGTAYRSGAGYDATTTLSNILRLSEIPPFFRQTIYSHNGDWWPFGGTNGWRDLFHASRVLGAGWGSPDLRADLQYNTPPDRTKTDIEDVMKQYAGQLPVHHGMEWDDYLKFSAEPYPKAHMDYADLQKTNFIHWTMDSQVYQGGYGFTQHALPYLRLNPGAGITTTCPSNIVCATSVSVKLNEVESPESIYPNPVKDLLQINPGIKNATVSIINIYGNVVIQKKVVDTESSIDMGGLPIGIYLVKIENQKTVIVRKIIKK